MNEKIQVLNRIFKEKEQKEPLPDWFDSLISNDVLSVTFSYIRDNQTYKFSHSFLRNPTWRELLTFMLKSYSHIEGVYSIYAH